MREGERGEGGRDSWGVRTVGAGRRIIEQRKKTAGGNRE